MAAASDKMLAEIIARMSAGRDLMSNIEISLGGHGECYHWIGAPKGVGYCDLVRRIPNQKIKICNDCPLWKTTDATYEEVYGTHILQTYDWWRSEFLRTGQAYAKDRMVDFIKTWQPEPELESEPPAPAHQYVYKVSCQTLMLGIALGVVLTVAIQTLMATWPFLFSRPEAKANLQETQKSNYPTRVLDIQLVYLKEEYGQDKPQRGYRAVRRRSLPR